MRNESYFDKSTKRLKQNLISTNEKLDTLLNVVSTMRFNENSCYKINEMASEIVNSSILIKDAVVAINERLISEGTDLDVRLNLLNDRIMAEKKTLNEVLILLKDIVSDEDLIAYNSQLQMMICNAEESFLNNLEEISRFIDINKEQSLNINRCSKKKINELKLDPILSDPYHISGYEEIDWLIEDWDLEELELGDLSNVPDLSKMTLDDIDFSEIVNKETKKE